MVWKKYNGRIIAACIVILVLCMTGVIAGCETEREEAREEQQSDTAAGQEQQAPASVIEESDAAELEQTDSGAEEDSEIVTSEAAEVATSDAVESKDDFGPVSYDLTNLPAMENERYAEWEGRIYYRQYSDEDMDEGGLWAIFLDVPGTVKEIMCMEPDGSVTQVGVDYGCDEFYIVNGRIYSSNGNVYSCALDGSDVSEYDSYHILDVRGDKIICAMGENAIAWIDARDGQEHILIPKNDSYHGAEYLDATEDEVFLYKLVWNEEAEALYPYTPYDLILYSVDYQGNTKDLATFTMQEYADYCVSEEFLSIVTPSPLFISFFRILGEDLYFSVGTTNGTASVYSAGMIYRVKKDGSGLTRFVDGSPTARFYLYDDGVNSSLYYKGVDEGTGWVLDGMQQIVLQGEAVEGITPRDADETVYERPRTYTSDSGADEILFYPDTSGVCYVLLTQEESEALCIRTYVDGDHVQQIEDIEYLNGKLFFTVTDLVYSTEYSIGWRDGYERGRSACYCKDLESGEIRLLYEYGG